jgi:hypothetical protein
MGVGIDMLTVVCAIQSSLIADLARCQPLAIDSNNVAGGSISVSRTTYLMFSVNAFVAASPLSGGVRGSIGGVFLSPSP